MASHLTDLDELILKCRNKEAKEHISEAVNCYRSGAFRAAIVTTWVAVCFDIIDKLRELALAGDVAAQAEITQLEATRKSANPSQALAFEKKLLEMSKDNFEFISELEFSDLQRLQQDRNRCAHPSLTSDDEVYRPAAELVRLHIHSAVNYLLQHPPAQGKYMLERLGREIESEYFPTDVGHATTHLLQGPLKRAKVSLIRSLISILLKKIIDPESEWKPKMRYSAALKAVAVIQSRVYSDVMSSQLTVKFRGLPDDQLYLATDFLTSFESSWQFLEADVRQKLNAFVVNLPKERLSDLEELLANKDLQISAKSRVLKMTASELKGVLFFTLPIAVENYMVERYLKVNSYESANDWAKAIISFASDLDKDCVLRIITKISENSEITGSFQIGPLINSLRQTKQMPDDEFEATLKANGLSAYAKETAPLE